MNYDNKKEYFSKFADLFESNDILTSFRSIEQLYALIEVLEISCENEIESIDNEFVFTSDNKFYKALQSIVCNLYNLRSDLRDISNYGESFR